MNHEERVRLERRFILNLMNSIEDKTNKMFHEILPEVDQDFHENAYENLKKLKTISYTLQKYIDQLNMD